MKSTVNFCYEKRTIEIQCTNNEEMKSIFKRCAIKLLSNENNFDFIITIKKLVIIHQLLNLQEIKKKLLLSYS